MAKQKNRKNNNGKRDKHDRESGQLTNIISKRSFNQWKYNAKRRGIEWNLTIEYLQELFISQNEICPVTHQKLTFVKNSSRHGKLQTASLDRIENDKGYIEGNVRFVTKYFNLLKNVLSDEKLVEYCKRIITVHDYKKLINTSE